MADLRVLTFESSNVITGNKYYQLFLLDVTGSLQFWENSCLVSQNPNNHRLSVVLSRKNRVLWTKRPVHLSAEIVTHVRSLGTLVPERSAGELYVQFPFHHTDYYKDRDSGSRFLKIKNFTAPPRVFFRKSVFLPTKRMAAWNTRTLARFRAPALLRAKEPAVLSIIAFIPPVPASAQQNRQTAS